MSADNLKISGLTIVLPCFNPPDEWHKVVVDTIKAFQPIIPSPISLIIVNDGSTSNVESTKVDAISTNLSDFQWISYPENRGKGYALRKGVEAAKTDLIIYTDIDFPYLQKSLIDLFRKLSEGHDVVLGHRGKEYYSKTPFLRKIISKSLRWVLKTFLRLPTDDSQCGIKGFNRKGAEVFVDTKIDRFLFDLEFIKLSAKRKLDIQTVKVELKPDVVFSKVNFKILFRESINFFKVLFRK